MSQLANKFVSDAREVVKTGDIVKVKVLEVDLARGRVSLTMQLDAPTPLRGEGSDNAFRSAGRDERPRSGGPRVAEAPGGAMAAAFAKLVPRS